MGRLDAYIEHRNTGERITIKMSTSKQGSREDDTSYAYRVIDAMGFSANWRVHSTQIDLRVRPDGRTNFGARGTNDHFNRIPNGWHHAPTESYP